MVIAAAALWLAPVPAQARPLRDPADAAGPLDLASVALRQSGRSLELTLRTRGAWAPSQLAGRGRFLCLELEGVRGVRPRRRACVGSRRVGGRAQLLLRGARGAHRLRTRFDRPSARVIRARFPMEGASVSPGRLRWRVLSGWSGPECAAPTAKPCIDAAPDARPAVLHVRTPYLVGCRPRHPGLRTHGSRRRRMVALTFDDGPSAYTPAVLRTLQRFHAHASFFIVGTEVRGRGAVLRRMLHEGNEPANHSLTHPMLPGPGQLRSTSAAIRRAAGFRPCLFRPPYGAVNSGLVHSARSDLIRPAGSLGMLTVTWDVDPRDWSLPAPATIAARVLHGMRRGAIVVMPDGGGPRGSTVAALRTILHGVRTRHYRAVTVSELLGNRLTWGPR